jgi:maleate isomerase
MNPHYSDDHRIGIIVPSLNVTIEPEFNAALPQKVSLHATRLLLKAGTKKNLREMSLKIEEACKLLDTAKVNAILYACTTGSLVGGRDWERSLVQKMKRSTGLPVATTAGAVVEALHELEVKRIAVGTPYSQDLNLVEQKFFEDNEFEVTCIRGLGHTKGEELHLEPPSTTVELANKVNSKDADAVFLSCTDLKTFTVLELLERKLGKPVVSSNSASLWKALRLLHVMEEIRGLGSLFRLNS